MQGSGKQEDAGYNQPASGPLEPVKTALSKLGLVRDVAPSPGSTGVTALALYTPCIPAWRPP